MKRFVGWVALACGVMTNGAVQAEACWDQRSVEAAQVREFDIMLMVSALRCQVKGADFVADYNRFVSSNKPALVSVNDEIRAHLNAEMGGKAALDAYDRMSTAMANHYGNGGGMGEDCAELRAIVVGAVAANPTDSTRAFLLANAQRVGIDPALTGGRCATVVAQNQMVAEPFPVARTAPVAPIPFPVMAAYAGASASAH